MKILLNKIWQAEPLSENNIKSGSLALLLQPGRRKDGRNGRKAHPPPYYSPTIAQTYRCMAGLFAAYLPVLDELTMTTARF